MSRSRNPRAARATSTSRSEARASSLDAASLDARRGSPCPSVSSAGPESARGDQRAAGLHLAGRARGRWHRAAEAHARRIPRGEPPVRRRRPETLPRRASRRPKATSPLQALRAILRDPRHLPYAPQQHLQRDVLAQTGAGARSTRLPRRASREEYLSRTRRFDGASSTRVAGRTSLSHASFRRLDARRGKKISLPLGSASMGSSLGCSGLCAAIGAPSTFRRRTR